MKIIELDKRFCREEYGGNYQRMIEEEDGVIFDDERIRNAFSGGHGTGKDLMRFINDNRIFARYYDMENHKYIA